MLFMGVKYWNVTFVLRVKQSVAFCKENMKKSQLKILKINTLSQMKTVNIVK